MSKIKVYVRVRPALPGEFDVPGCFQCTEMEDVSGNWIQIKKEGEPKRYFARCWGPMSGQEEVFRTIGVNTVNDVFEGYYGCIFVYGQTGTGKTFTLGCQTPGLEGIQPRCLKMIYEKTARESAKYDVVVKHQYVQLYRDSVQDLLDIGKDNMMVRVDEKDGATIEGVTTRECTRYEEALDLVVEGDKNRTTANTKMNSASSRSHACLITEVHRTEKATGTKTFGRLYLIDLAGSERVAKSGVTGDAHKEAVAINKSLTTLGNCIAGLVNGEKVVAFRDSKLTRLLQHSLSGNGRTSIVVTIRPDSPNMQETLCTLKFGERAQKVETQMTPAAYRDQLVELQEKTGEQERAMAEAVQSATLCKRWAIELKQSVQDKEAEVRALETCCKEECDQLKSDCEQEKRQKQQELDGQKSQIDAQTNDELERLKTANASVLEEIDQRVEEATKKTKERCRAELKPLQEQLDKNSKEYTKIKEQVDAADFGDEESFEEEAAKKLQALSLQHEKLKTKLRGCKASPNEGLSVWELNEKKEKMMELLDKITAKRDSLLARASGWDIEEINKAAPQRTVQQTTEFLEQIKSAPPPPDSDDESSAPPSSTPPPTDSDEDSSETDSSDSSETDSSETDSSGTDSDESDASKVELDLSATGGPSVARKRFFKEKVPRAHFDHSLKRDRHLAELLEQISEYLEYGCTCYVVNTKTAPISIHRRHMFLGKSRKSLCLAEYKDGTNQPDRHSGREVMQVSDITDLMLGQFTDGFAKALEGAPMVPQGTTMPPTSAKITLNSLPVFFYRSLSVWNHDTPVIDLVFDTDTDFEAWIVTLHRYTMKDPRWGGPLDITSAKDVARLSDEEKKLCSDAHILPTCLLATKNTILHKEQRLFYTLFDMRAVSSLDLLHAQKLFEFFFKQKYFDRVNVYHVRYLEMMREIEEEKRLREEARQLRIRIVNMCRKYVPDSSGNALHEFLRTINGKEKETLDHLVATHGPEPTEEEIKELGGKEAAEKEVAASLERERKKDEKDKAEKDKVKASSKSDAKETSRPTTPTKPPPPPAEDDGGEAPPPPPDDD